MERSDGRCLLCSICYVTLALQSPSIHPPLPSTPLALAPSLSLSPLPLGPSLSRVFSFHLSTNLFALSFPLPLVRSTSSQVCASPPSYIQQTPSIYSFELDGSKGKVAGCCSVNFRPLKYLVSSLFLSLSLSFSLTLPVRLPILCFFALIYRSQTQNERE